MNRTPFGILLGLALLGGGSFAAAPEKDKGDRPDKFPTVSLLPDSEPKYAALAANSSATKVAYVLFDGNIKTGYKRIHVWVPGDPKYMKPATLQVQQEGGKFAPIKFEEKTMAEQSTIVWTLSWVKGGGDQTYTDYMTGQSKKVRVPDYNLFSFNCDYVHKPRVSGARSSGGTTIDLGIPGSIDTADAWDKMTATLIPWQRLYHYMVVKTTTDKKDTGRVHLTGKISHLTTHYGWADVTVRAMPDEAVMTLCVSPYMGAPTYSNTLDSAKAFLQGVDIDLPYGWYDIAWDIDCEGLKSTQRSDHIYLQPYPVPKPGPM